IAEFFGCLLTRLAPEFINDLQELFPAICGHIFFPKKICPKFAVADSNSEVFFGKSERTQNIDAERHQLEIGCEIGFADDVAVQLKMFAETTTLLFLVAKELANREPLKRLLKFTLMRSHDAGERGRQLGA